MESYYIGNASIQVDSLIEKVSVIKESNRLPRKVSERQFWKASEYMNFLLHYGLPLLDGILPPKLYRHFSIFVIVMQTLLSEKISKLDLELCKSAMKVFVSQSEQFYSPKMLTYNVHLLLHFPHMVEMYGPLWAYSCFSFENACGVLKESFCGTQAVARQMCANVLLSQNLTCHLDKVFDNTNISNNFPDLKRKYSVNLHKKSIVAGRKMSIHDNGILSFVDEHDKCAFLSHLTFNGIFLSSFNKDKKRCDSVVQTHSRKTFMIKTFLCIDEEYFFIGNELDLAPFPIRTINGLTNHNCFEVQVQNSVSKVSLNEVTKKCFFFSIDGKTFASIPPNKIEFGKINHIPFHDSCRSIGKTVLGHISILR